MCSHFRRSRTTVIAGARRGACDLLHMVCVRCAQLLLAPAMSACDREDRLAVRPAPLPETGPASVALTPLQAGEPVPAHSDPRRKEYEYNAYHLALGQRYYVWFNCNGCHANGGGDSGPPHIDEAWRYGGSIEQIYASIRDGRPNGMPSFRGKLTDQQMWQIAGYVRSLSGNVPKDAAPGRTDHMKTQNPPNEIKQARPIDTTKSGSVQGTTR